MNEELKVIITAEIADLKKNVQNAQKEIKDLSSKGESNFKKFGEAAKKAGTAIANGLKIAAGAIAAAGAALIALSEGTAEFRANQAKLTSSFEAAGAGAEQAKETYIDLYRVLGDDGQATEAATHLAQLTTNEKDLAEWTNICQGVYATFGDSLPIESLTEAANETAKTGALTGALADALNWAGISEDEFQAKLDACNTEAEREAAIRETLNGIYDDAALAYENNAGAIMDANEAQARLTDGLAALGEAVEPIVTILKTELADTLERLTPAFETLSGGLQDILKGVEGGADKLSSGINEITDTILEKLTELLPQVLNVGLEVITSLLTGIIQALPSVITAITELLPQVVDTLITIIPQITGAILEALPMLLETVVQVVVAIAEGLAAMLPIIIEQVITVVPTLIQILIDSIPLLLDAGILLLMAIVDAIPQIIPPLIDALPMLVENLVITLLDSIPVLLEAAVQLFMALVAAIPLIIEPLIKALGAIIKTIITNLSDRISEVFGNIKTAIKNKITEAKNIVVEKFTEIKTNITNKITDAKNAVLNIFDNIKNGMRDKIASARDLIKGIIETIKGFFNFTFKIPDIKLPHFTIKPKGWKLKDLLEGEIPKLSIDWYAKGGVFTKPTLFNNNGRLSGLGEAGAEAIVPLEKNTQWLDKIADKLAAKQGNTPIVLNVDGKTFAQISVDSINALTRQKGALPLVLG